MAFLVLAAIPPSGSDAVILWTFLAAALVFVLCWAIRAASGKPGPGPSVDQPTVAGMSAEEAALYAPPAALPPPLPAAYLAESSGPFKVTPKPYRRLDVAFIGVVFLIYAGLTASSGGPDPAPIDQRITPDLLVASMFFQLLLMGMVIGFVRWRIRLTEWLGLRWRAWPLVLAIAPATVFFMWCLLGVLHVSGWNAWLERSLGIESMQDAVKLLQQAQDPLVVALMAVAAVIVAPVAEEIVFRGYLYPAAKRFCGPTGAMIFSSLVFAAAHGNVVALLPLFILAVLLCLIFEFTGSIWANISVHFLFNAATVAIQLLARSGLVDVPAQ